MPKATCDWCNAVIGAPKNYNPLQHAIYCSPHCVQKDWLFKRWQNDKFLNFIAKEYKGEANQITTRKA